VLALVVVLLDAPGFLVASALDPARPFLDGLAPARAVSVAIGFGIASLTGSGGLGGAPAALAGALVVASVAGGAVLLRRPRSGVPWRTRVRRSLLVLAIGSWCGSSRTPRRAPAARW
jgi:ABC-type xylose transport system permease subunit